MVAKIWNGTSMQARLVEQLRLNEPINRLETW